MRSFLTIASLTIALISGSSAIKAQNILITEAEAQTPNLQLQKTRAITRGPGINLLTQSEVMAKSFTLKVVFEPRGGSKIDSSSVKFEYLKQPIIDLTPRIRAGLNGNQLDLSMLSVPPGQHPIRVSVRDSEGREGYTVIYLSAK
jgi:hypothetical protein